MRLASLPWYDVKPRVALDRFWSVLAEELSGRGATGFGRGLDRETPLTGQRSHPDLVISQCCGSDLFTRAAARGWSDLGARISGSHEESLELVRAGTADLAAIDAHSWTRLDPESLSRYRSRCGVTCESVSTT